MIGFKEHPFFRCVSCGSLVDDDLISQGVCGGHAMRPVVNGSIFEWIWMERRKFKKHGKNGLFLFWLYKQYVGLKKEILNVRNSYQA